MSKLLHSPSTPPPLQLSLHFAGTICCGRGERKRANEELRHQGPLVGELKLSKALVIEYADADPTYVAKTSVRLCTLDFFGFFSLSLIRFLRVRVRRALLMPTHCRAFRKNTIPIVLCAATATVDGEVRRYHRLDDFYSRRPPLTACF